MAHPNFADDIKPIFANYVDTMLQVMLSDDNGTAPLNLGDYQSVKRFHHAIQVAIHGYEDDSNAPHPMPPPPPDGPGPLADADIKKFDDWITIGMPEADTDLVA